MGKVLAVHEDTGSDLPRTHLQAGQAGWKD